MSIMASSTSLPTDDQLNITKCSICQDIYADPRSLPCLHTFCLRCIEGLSRRQGSDTALPCPVCRKEFHVPHDRIDRLPENVFIKKLLRMEKLSSVDADGSSSMCEQCLIKDQTSATVEIELAQLVCLDCKMKLCQSCADRHKKKDSPTRSHKCVRLESVTNTTGDLSKLLDANCPEHDGKLLKLYCFDCDEAICVSCSAGKHKKHKSSDIDKAEVQFRGRMKNGAKNLLEDVDRCRQQIERLETIKSTFADRAANTANDVIEHAVQMKQRIDQEKETVLQQVESRKQWGTAKIDRAIADLQRHINLVDILRRYTDVIQDKGTTIDIARENKGLQNKAEELLKYDAERPADELDPMNVRFTASNLLTNAGERAIGKITVTFSKDELVKPVAADNGSSDTKSLELLDITQCHICSRKYSNPRYLPCRHTFCLSCIEGITERRPSIHSVVCPLCHKESKFAGGPDALPRNFFVEKLVKVEELSSSSDATRYCEVCSSSETATVDKKPSVVYCVPCKLELCSSCQTDHDRKSATTRTHQRVNFGGADATESRDILKKLPDAGCEHHDGEKLIFFCSDCRAAICVQCFAEAHQKHRFSEIAKIDAKLRQEMTTEMKAFAGNIDKYRKVISRVAAMRHSVSSNAATVIGQVCDHAEKLNQAIDDDKERLLTEITVSDKTIGMDRALKELTRHVALVEMARRYVDELQNKGTVVDVAREIGALQRVRNELVKYDGDRAVRDLTAVKVVFTASNALQAAGRNVVGTVNVQQSGQDAATEGVVHRPPSTRLDLSTCPICTDVCVEPKSLPCQHTFCRQCLEEYIKDNEHDTSSAVCPVCRKPVQLNGRSTSRRPSKNPSTASTELPKSESRRSTRSGPTELPQSRRSTRSGPVLTRVLEKGDTLRGMTVLEDKLAVVRWPTEQRIELYDLTSFDPLDPVVINGLSNVSFGMTSCPVNRCLYVSDWQHNLVHRVRLTSTSGRGGPSPVTSWKVSSDPTGLSVNRHFDVLVVYWGSSTLHEFTTDGALVRRITLQPDIVNPWHAIQLSSGQFVVGHGEAGDPLNRVCVVDMDGRVVLSYGDRPGSAPGQLNVPVSLAVADDSAVLVADQGNSRVLVCRPSLSGARDLLSAVECELRSPCVLCLDQSRGRLYVGEWHGRVLVFDNVAAV